VQYPSQLATISTLVPADLLHSAVSLNSAGFNVARILGPAAAGLLLGLGEGATVCFLLNAASFLVPLLALRLLPAVSAGSRTSDASVTRGIVVMWRTPALRRLVLGCAGFTFGAAPLTTLAPVYASALGGGPGWLGVLLGAFGAGAALGSGLVVRLARRHGRSVVIPGAMVGFAVASAAAALAPSPWLAAPLCAVSGVFWLAVFSSTNASVQLISSDAIRGRMLALYLWALIGPMAISAPVIGWLAGRIGIREALVACSASVAVAGLFGLARRVPAIDATRSTAG
jgi:MFS family permease